MKKDACREYQHQDFEADGFFEIDKNFHQEDA